MEDFYLSRLDEANLFGQRLRLVSAANATLVLEDQYGKQAEYLDFMSAYGAVNFGHCNPRIQSVMEQIEPKADIAACFYPKEAEEFAHWLCNRLQLPQYRVLFQLGGSFAVSTALALAQRWHLGRIACIEGSFHGLGVDSLSATTIHKDFALQETPLLETLTKDIVRIHPSEIPTHWDDISCLIYEPIQGANGYIPLESTWLQALTESAAKNGVITIADEIQCGFFRHGTLSPARRIGLTPDILLYSKSMTNGLFPFSAVVYRRDLEEKMTSPITLAHTFQTSAIGCYAAYAVSQYLDSHALESDITRINRQFLTLKQQLAEMPNVNNLYVTGPTLSFEVTSGGARKLVQKALLEGLMVFTGGSQGQRIRVAPPLITSDEQIEYASKILLKILPII